MEVSNKLVSWLIFYLGDVFTTYKNIGVITCYNNPYTKYRLEIPVSWQRRWIFFLADADVAYGEFSIADGEKTDGSCKGW